MPIRPGLLLLMMCLVIVFTPVTPSFAASAIVENSNYNSLTGDAKFIGSAYRDNYDLDMRQCTLLEKGPEATNSIANAMFQGMKNLSYITISLIDICFNFDVATLFGSQIDAFQKATKDNIFDELFMLAFCWTAWSMIKQIVRRSMPGVLMEIAKVILISCLSMALVTNSSTMISGMSAITRGVSVDMLTQVAGSDSTGFSKDAAGTLWSVLVHRPYVDLEGGDVITDSQVETILGLTPGTAERKNYISNLNVSSNQKLFDLNWAGLRLGKLMVLAIPVIVKCLTFMFLAILQVAFQFLALFFFILAPIVLLFAMIPDLGGLNAITNWLKKVLETQLAIVILTAMIVILVKMDQMLYSQANAFGWLVILFIQTFLCVFMVLKHNEIINMITGMAHGQMPTPQIRNPKIPKIPKAQTVKMQGSKESKAKMAGGTKKTTSEETASESAGESSTSDSSSEGEASTSNMRAAHQQNMDRQNIRRRRTMVADSGVTRSAQMNPAEKNQESSPQATVKTSDKPSEQPAAYKQSSAYNRQEAVSQSSNMSSVENSASRSQPPIRPDATITGAATAPPQLDPQVSNMRGVAASKPGQPGADPTETKHPGITLSKESMTAVPAEQVPASNKVSAPEMRQSKDYATLSKSSVDSSNEPVRHMDSPAVVRTAPAASDMHVETQTPAVTTRPVVEMNLQKRPLKIQTQPRINATASKPPTLDGPVYSNMQAHANQSRGVEPQTMKHSRSGTLPRMNPAEASLKEE